jgi:nucleoside-triphosphatase
VLLLTGAPGVGKTTLVEKVARALPRAPGGFATTEIRDRGQRVGFRITPFEAEARVMAHVDFSGAARIGRYGVDVAAIDAVVETALALDSGRELYVVDEIGRMECLSRRFVEAMRALLDSRRLVVGTVAERGGGFIDRVRARRDVELWEVTPRNRDALVREVLAWIRASLPAGSRS